MKLLLVLAQLLRDCNGRPHVQGPAPAARHARHALAAERDQGAARGARRHVHVMSPPGPSTLNEPPIAITGKGTGTSTYRSSPSRWNVACGFTWMTTYRSPGGPPCCAVLALALEPQALAVGDAGGNAHRHAAIARGPSGAAARDAGIPDDLARPAALCRTSARRRGSPAGYRIWPVPRHCGHVSRDVPAAAPEPLHVSQCSSRGIWIVVSAPAKDSSNAISRSKRRSAPRVGPPRRPPPPKPKKSPRMSEKSAKMSGLNPGPPGPPPAAPPTPAWPKRS